MLAENINRADESAGLLEQPQPVYRKAHTVYGINVKNLEQYTNNVADFIGQLNAMIEELKTQVGSLQIDTEKFDTKSVGLQKNSRI